MFMTYAEIKLQYFHEQFLLGRHAELSDQSTTACVQ